MKLALALNELLLLNWTCVLLPAALVVNTYGVPFAYKILSVLRVPVVVLPWTVNPSDLITTTLAVPLILAVMFPLNVPISTLLLPLLIADPVPGGDHWITPLPFVVNK